MWRIVLTSIDLGWLLLIRDWSILLNICLFVEISGYYGRVTHCWVKYLARSMLGVWTSCSVWASFQRCLFAAWTSRLHYFRLLMLHGCWCEILWRLLVLLVHLVFQTSGMITFGLSLNLLLRSLIHLLRLHDDLIWLSHHGNILIWVLWSSSIGRHAAHRWFVLCVWNDTWPAKAKLGLSVVPAICSWAPTTSHWWKAILA